MIELGINIDHVATVRQARRTRYPSPVQAALIAETAGADLIIHGHAHAGTEKGVTPGGIPVRNVAQHVIGSAYRLYCLGNGALQ
jgi:hypothetical protein